MSSGLERMRIALVESGSEKNFAAGFASALSSRGIEYGYVDVSNSAIVEILKEYDGLMWHFAQGLVVDYLMAKPLLSALEASGFPVFPPVSDIWHFDDKLAQKYLLEAIAAPTPQTWIFYDRSAALRWLANWPKPLVLKLRGGAASSNVKLISNNLRGRRLVRKCFWPGYRQFDRIALARDEVIKVKSPSLTAIFNAARAIGKIFLHSPYEKVRGRERGYVLMQEFLPGNEFDTRIVVVGQRAFGLRRFNRPGDFRASGSGFLDFDEKEISSEAVSTAFKIAKILGTSCLAFDFLFRAGRHMEIAEISFGFVASAYRNCTGYWDERGCWHQSKFPKGAFQLEDFIVDDFIARIKTK